jgi:hypothetical protein
MTLAFILKLRNYKSFFDDGFLTIIKEHLITIIIYIQGWAIWPVPSPELQLLPPSFFQSPNCSLSLWAVVV